jgi:hypothetical protein
VLRRLVCFMAPPRIAASHGDLLEGLAGAPEDGIAPGVGLPSSHNDIHVSGIDLKPITTSAHTFSGYDSGAGAQEWIEHDVTAPGTVAHRVSHKGDRLDVGCSTRSSRRPARNVFTPG